MFVSMITRTDERTRFDIFESQLQPNPFKFRELLWSIKLLDGQSTLGRLQVLADSQHIAIYLTQIFDRLNNLFRSLTEADHDSRFRQHSARFPVAAFGGPPEQPDCPLAIPRVRADAVIKPWHSFGVVIEHIRPGIQNDVERFIVAFEIRDEDFDLALWIELSDRPDSRSEMRCAAVRGV